MVTIIHGISTMDMMTLFNMAMKNLDTTNKTQITMNMFEFFTMFEYI